MARREWQNPSILTRKSAGGPEWYFRYRVKVLDTDANPPVIRRVERWKALGLCAKMTKRQAEREKDRILREVNNEVYTIQSQLPWADFARMFDENHIAHLAVPTQANYRQQLRKHITPFFDGQRIGRIGPFQVQALIRSLESKLSHSTRTTIKGVLTAAFKCARKWKLIESDPMEGIDVGKGPRAVRECRVPSLDDIGNLMDLCGGDVPLLIETLCVTGMRISEAAGLDVSHLDFQNGLIHVVRRRCRGDVGDTKTFSGKRDLSMGNVAEALAAHVAGKAASDPVFRYNGEPIVDNALLDNYVTPRMVKLGIKFPGFGWHTFRRWHLSMMSRQGLTLFDLRRQAGHASIKTTQRYIVDDMGKRTDAAKALPFLMKKGA